MAPRLLSLAALHLGLLALNPDWVVIEWDNPIAWLAVAPVEEAVAALIRSAALLLTGSQLAALALIGLSTLVGSGRLGRAAQRALLPALRTAAPVALMASTALPVAAMETRLPITPPPVTQVVDLPSSRTPEDAVTVRSGDSMWTIAADRVDGDPSSYWRRVVDVNRDRFADVDLIHPGDTVLLPPLN